MSDFTTGKPMKQILAFSVPLLLGNIFQQMFTLIDTMIVGRFIGGSALAAVGSASTIINFLVSLLMGLMTGASVVVSQFYGARKAEEIRRTFSTTVIFSAVITLVLTGLGIILAEPMLRMLGVDDSIMPNAKIYLQFFMGGLIFVIYYNLYVAYMRALGDSRRPLYALIFAVSMNLILDYLFVVVFDFGIVGVAAATTISYFLATIICIYIAKKYMPGMIFKKFIFDKKLFFLIIKYGFPASIQMSLTSFAQLTIMRLVNSFGTAAVAGFTAGSRIDNLALMPLSNINAAISTFVGQNMGADKEDRAHEGLKSGMKLMLIIGVITTVVVLIFGKAVMGLFVQTSDADYAEIIRIGSSYLAITCLFYILFGVFFAFNGFFRGVGDAVVVMVLTIVSLTIRSVSAHIMAGSFNIGPNAIAWSIPIGWGICGFVAFIYYKKGFWRGKSAVKSIK